MKSCLPLLALLLMVSIATALQSSTITTIPTDGEIRQTMASLLFSTNFEGVTGSGSRSTDAWISNPLSGFGTEHGIQISGGGGEWWMEGLDRNSGILDRFGQPFSTTNRCFGQSMLNAYRNDFMIWDNDIPWGYSKTYYIQFWHYIPSYFDIDNGSWWEFCEFDDALEAPYKPSVDYFFYKTSSGVEQLHVGWTNGPSGGGDYGTIYVPFTFPRGRWFKVGIFVDVGTIDSHDGLTRLYIDDELKITDSGYWVHYSGNSGKHPGFKVPGIYTGIGAAGGYKVTTKAWTDDVEIWDGIPGT